MPRTRKTQKSRRVNAREQLRRRPLLARLLLAVVRGFVYAISGVGKPFYYTLSFTVLYTVVFTASVRPVVTHLIDRIFGTKKPTLARDKTTKTKREPAPVTVSESKQIPAVTLIRGTPASFIAGAFVTFMITSSATFFYFFVLKDLPSPRELATREPILSTKIYDRNGTLLYTVYKDEKRTLVPISSIPIALKSATIAIEDKDFYHHKGLSFTGMLRAFQKNIEKQTVQGGSTITQQLIKNTLLTREKTLRRKMKEAVLALLVESSFTKDEILEMYFNENPYGGTIYGAEEASRKYFGKSVTQLSLAESAYLAGLPQAPSAYSPFGPTPELGFARQQLVLQRMAEDGYITPEQVAEAKAEKLVFQNNTEDIKAPHFVMYVKDLLAKKYGEHTLAQGGLEVITTLDLTIQTKSEEAIQKELEKLKRFRVGNGAALVSNPKTGEILAMVGSRDYFDVAKDGQVNVTIRPRQPGSSIKPLTYATAMEKGLTPSSIIDDEPITYKVVGSPPYSPKNYDGKFHGKVTVRTALASSYNIPAVKTLASVGVQSVVEKARMMGITTWDEESAKRFGLSLTLGGGEVFMTDMSVLYGTFANNGLTVPLDPIIQIKDHKGKILYKNACYEHPDDVCDGTKTLDPRVAWQITSILSDNVARAPAFGTNSVLNIPKQQVAVKTGTTNSLRDNWTFGYTTNRLVATWVGNNDNAPMSNVASGITGASPIWNVIMKSLLDEKNPHVFAAPEGLIKLRICSTTGTLMCSACTSSKEDYFVPGTEPKKACTEEMFASPTPLPDGQMPQPTPMRNRILDGATITR